MFDISKDMDKAIQKVTINIGDLLGLEKKEDCHVTLCEPEAIDTVKIQRIQKEENKAEWALEYFQKIFPSILVDHDIMNGERKASKDEVCKLIFKKLPVANYVVSEYFDAVFRSPQQKTSEK